MSRITIDPVTRIEGHLRIDAEVDGGFVRKAWSSGQMFRGIERILQGRDPREAWLFTQRFCGVCTTVHAIASVRAVENALQLAVPLNAQYIRNIIVAAHAMHDHIVHFYHLSALDWVDVVSALKADPVKTSQLAESLSSWPGNSRMQLTAVRDRLKGFVDNGQLGIFQNGYWGHPAMRLSPEVNLLAVSHYLEALEYQRKINQVVAILGGKTPNIQNLAVGGIGAMYADWFGYGKAVTNYLSVPDLPLDTKGTQFDFPGGVIMNGDLAHVQEIKTFNEEFFRDNVTESIARSWYDGNWSRHPYKETTEPKYAPFQDNGKYSWVKAPRFKGTPMQVGPLAQVLTGYALGHKPTVYWANKTLETAGSIAKTTLTPAVLHSTLGRHAARMIRTQVIADLAEKHWNLLVNNIGKGDTDIFNEPVFPKGEQRGFGFHEAPRGTLSHWIVIRDGKIANYQAVVPSTWNAGPRDENDQPGPYEASLVGNPVANAELPLELIRTVHSFDPCLACAVHTVDVEGNEIAKVKAL